MMRTTVAGPQLVQPATERDHIIGPINAPVTMVEYGDYECPYCGAAFPQVKEVQRVMGERLCFVFRHFPLTRSHPHAQQAAEAAECANAQAWFWPMHEMLFENQQSLGYRNLLTYAALLDLDVDRFAHELAGHVHAGRVREDFLSGVRSGVNGTPTFFINGRRHDGGYDAASLLRAMRLHTELQL